MAHDMTIIAVLTVSLVVKSDTGDVQEVLDALEVVGGGENHTLIDAQITRSEGKVVDSR